MTRNQRLNTLFKKYGLDKDEDFHTQGMGNRKIAYVTKSGIEKIINKEGIEVMFEHPYISPDLAVIKAYARAPRDGKTIRVETYASAESSNVKNKQKYYVEMAEKRAKGRAVLILLGMHGIFKDINELSDDKVANISKL